MNTLIFIRKMIRYNMKIIFANKFIWFFLAALGFYLFFMVNSVWEGARIDSELVYNIILFPGILLIFYPTVFGIQHDADSRILEILFGIPDYRYKVWLVRLVLIFVQTYLILVVFGLMASLLLYPVNIWLMALQVMFPVLFLGCLAFMVSTLVRNGNGTAVVMVIIGVLLLIFSNSLYRTMWNIFMNPYDIPRGFNEMIWQTIALKNRIFLAVGAIVFMLYGLFNLQKREKFA
ncbi:hypothetical protein EMN47_18775 [Prolixibacteraceae bacterium JC049]|nr:hypothetical protein [Prolixibacteraceae bacterium JC049]